MASPREQREGESEREIRQTSLASLFLPLLLIRPLLLQQLLDLLRLLLLLLLPSTPLLLRRRRRRRPRRCLLESDERSHAHSSNMNISVH